MRWNQKFSFHVGGVTDVGFNESGALLQVSSHSGRGLFSLDSGELIARDNDSTYTWHYETTVAGIGPLTGSQVRVYGIWSEMTSETKEEMASFDIDSHITEFKGAALSDNGQLLAIAYSDEVQVYMRSET
jgi:hypothetical protein